MDNPTDTHSEWTFETLEWFDRKLSELAQSYRLNTFPNQIEIISTQQMIDNYTAIGMPVNYSHWSFGKQHVRLEQQYRQGLTGLAYELVINSNPCIAYLLEENNLTMQVMVLAHACYGHNSFFKNNYLFKTWTSPDAIVDYLLFAKKFIQDCEEKEGLPAVETLLDACHALMNHGVDRYKRPAKISLREEQARQTKREQYLQSQINELWNTIPDSSQTGHRSKSKHPVQERFPKEPEENLLYFLEKKAPLLEPWEREIIRITRKISQYFYPQKQTKLMNEGWATFWHYTLLNDLYTAGHVSPGFMLEFLHQHTNVITQPEFNDPRFTGWNPYALGFAMFKDIQRICQNPTDEDRTWFPEYAGQDWLETLHHAMQNFKDESFILQFLSPKVIRDFKLFVLRDDQQESSLEIEAIHNEAGYQVIREKLAQQYNLSFLEPNIQVYNVDHRGDRSLTLRYYQDHRRSLTADAQHVLDYFAKLWGFPTFLETVNSEQDVLERLSAQLLK